MTALHVEETGPDGAPLVVLVHGTMDRSTGFGRVARRLDDRYRVLRYDRRGYARSRDLAEPYGCTAQVDDLLSLLAGRSATAVGHSYGGNVALAASVRAPEAVVAVGIYEAPLPWLDWWPGTTAAAAALAAERVGGPEDAAEQFLRRLLGDALWERLPERTRAIRRAEGRALVGEMVDLRARPPWSPSDVTVPVVAGHGSRSQPHHCTATRWVVERVEGAELVVIDGASHGAHLSHPHAFADLVERAAARRESRPAKGP